MAKTVVIGIDLGSSESQVAYIGNGIIDMVQNEVSKRSTATLVGFTARERSLGDSALATIKSNAKNTCRNFKHLLGRSTDASDIKCEHFWSTSKLASAQDGFAGYDISYKGEQRVFSASEITAMFLTKLRDITEKWCQTQVADAVISVPSYFSDVQRQALLDAASIAGISVLRLMNEHTATALSYGIYRSGEFDADKPTTVAFVSMGHTLFSVSIVQFVRGKLTVLCEKSDKVGGRDMDECLMKVFAGQFQKKHGCAPLSDKKAAFKLEDAVNKTKKVLSANYEAGVSVECLMDDHDFGSNINREDFEKMCQPMMDRVKAVLEGAIAACFVPVTQIGFVEIVGGAVRVPWVKKMISEAFGGKELSTTMNQEESVARGCALQAAILSPLYKVRDFKVEDTSPFGVNVSWTGSPVDVQMNGGEDNSKTTTIFPAASPMGIHKMLTFFRKESFDVKAEYANPAVLLPLASKELGTYRVELPPQTERKKVKVKAKLTLNGCFTIEGAQLLDEDASEEAVKENKEAPPVVEVAKDGDTQMPEKKKEGAAEAQKDSERPKKRLKRTDLRIVVVPGTGNPGLSDENLQKCIDQENAMQAEMNAIVERDDKKNDLESYIFNMRDKTSASGELGAFITQPDREKFESALMKAEDWLYDTPDATKEQYVEKLTALKTQHGDKVKFRFKEHGARNQLVDALTTSINSCRKAAEAQGDRKLRATCSDLQKWLDDMKAKQDKLPNTEDPVLLCADLEKRCNDLTAMDNASLKEETKAATSKEQKPEETKQPSKPGAVPVEKEIELLD